MLKLILALSFFHISALSLQMKPPRHPKKPPTQIMPPNSIKFEDALDEAEDGDFGCLFMPESPKVDDPRINKAMLATIKTLIKFNDYKIATKEYRVKLLPKKYRELREKFSTVSPTVTFEEYFSWLIEKTKFEQNVFIVALILMDRFITATDIIMDSDVAHRLFLVALNAAQKSQLDRCYKNIDVAKVCGIEPKELNDLESEFLNAIKWRLVVYKKEIEKYRGEFETIAKSIALERDPFESKY